MERVMCYWNLHRKCFSLKSIKTGRVIAHRNSFVLFNAVTKVSEAGRQRVLREKRKNVHAGIVGDYDPTCEELAIMPESVYGSRKISYNPYRGPDFTYDDGTPVGGQFTAIMTNNGVKPSIYITYK